MSNYLFVYGTLMRGHSRHNLLQENGFEYLGCGRIAARLYSVPDEDYPAAVPAQDGNVVHGEFYRLPKNDSNKAMKLLDQEEAVEANLFTRLLMEVRPEIGDPMKAWVYVYVQELYDADLITSGRFVAQLDV